MDQNLKMVGTGRTATIFRYGEKKVVKLFKETFPEKAIEEEFAIGTILNDIDLDLPKTYERIDLNGRKGNILDYIEGKSMLQHLASKPWLVLSYSKRMALLHRRIHSATVPARHLIPSLKNSLADKISRVALLTPKERTVIVSRLSQLKDASAMCHGDFHPDNIIMTKNRLVTVDWITARIGNPIADVARTWLLLTMGTLPENKSAFEIYLAENLRNLFCRGYIREYKKLSNFTADEFEAWKLPVATARLIENVSDHENQTLMRFIRRELSKEL